MPESPAAGAASSRAWRTPSPPASPWRRRPWTSPAPRPRTRSQARPPTARRWPSPATSSRGLRLRWS
eukprot:SM000363S13642  [mRNA]  locus=s363:32399:32886:+ [translate_table: standard]